MLQLAIGAAGLTVAKTGEAEVFRDAGATRLFVHYPPLGDAKWERLARLAADGVEITVAVDSYLPAEGLSAALARHGVRASVLVELDVGMHRTGQASTRGALELARRLGRLSALEVAGISRDPGNCRGDEATGVRPCSPSTSCCARPATRSRGHPGDASPAARRRPATWHTRRA